MSRLHLLTKLGPGRAGEMCFGNPGQQGITGAEVAAALIGLEDGPLAFAYWHGTQDEVSKSQLRDCLATDLQRVATVQGWKRKNDMELFVRMSRAAIAEAFLSKEICKSCCGFGMQKGKICCKCQGLGRSALTRKKISELCGVASSMWRSRYEAKYNELKYLISEYQWSVERKLHAAFSNKKQEDEKN